MNIHNPSLSKLKTLQSKGVKELQYYTHSNPLVRWVFTNRLKAMANLTDSNTYDKVALDYGAGSGLFTLALSKNFKEVHSIDINTNPLEIIKKDFNLQNVKISKSSENPILNYPDNYFDAIYAADVLEHFPDSLEIQKEFKRVLKPFGTLIISGPTENSIYHLARRLLYWNHSPADHHTNIASILLKSKSIFNIEKVITLPSQFIPGFKVYKARKHNATKKELHR
jgi:ubiquinone/menaquinone biosynthesis C-methylase UbiE